jgi:hypothetical protein
VERRCEAAFADTRPIWESLYAGLVAYLPYHKLQSSSCLDHNPVVLFARSAGYVVSSGRLAVSKPQSEGDWRQPGDLELSGRQFLDFEAQ